MHLSPYILFIYLFIYLFIGIVSYDHRGWQVQNTSFMLDALSVSSLNLTALLQDLRCWARLRKRNRCQQGCVADLPGCDLSTLLHLQWSGGQRCAPEGFLANVLYQFGQHTWLHRIASICHQPCWSFCRTNLARCTSSILGSSTNYNWSAMSLVTQFWAAAV